MRPRTLKPTPNVRGESIVCLAKDAFRCFTGTELDILVVGDALLDKSEQTQPLIARHKDACALD
jgi:carbamoyltransferase